MGITSPRRGIPSTISTSKSYGMPSSSPSKSMDGFVICDDRSEPFGHAQDLVDQFHLPVLIVKNDNS